MRIVSVAARTVRWTIASGGAARGRSERTAVLLEVRSDRGAIGLGEAAPLPGMSLDTIDDAERAIDALAARVPFDVPDRETAFARVHAAVLAARALRGRADRERDAAALPTPAARFAIATALLDALAHERAVSLAALLRAPAAPTAPATGGTVAAHAGTVALAAVVDDPDGARRAFAAGIRCLKIKLGADDDPGRVLAIAAAAPAATLRIDANRSWPRAEVGARLAALAGLPIEYVEEPCVDAHLLLSAALPCKLALDESLSTLPLDELDAALRSGQLAALVLKPTLLGLSPVLALAERARRAGVAAVTSHGLEGPIGTAACAELALALGGDRAVGLARHAALDAWCLDVGQLAADHVHATGAPGLGFAALDLAGAVNACSATLDAPDGADGPPR
jgi:L-alanine-DL-glutamate epimerase-like enolase superfamily enzyme